MKYRRLWIYGTSFCFAAATFFFAGQTKVSAATLGNHTGLAGLSLYVDKYFDHYDELAAMPAAFLAKNVVGEEDAGEELSEKQGAASEEKALEKEKEQPVSEYENVGISVADPYVNIRTKPSLEGEITGKLYKGCAATILERDGEWVKITSGNAEGYINAEFLAIGFDAEELVEKYATRWAIVNVETLRVRMEPSTEARIATLVPQGERLLITSLSDEWAEISIDDGDITGYVFREFVDIEVEFEHAITIEEEQAEIRRKQEAEEAMRRQQEEQRKREEEAKKKKEEAASTNNNAAESNKTESEESSSGSSDLASSIVDFAKKFVGNPYVYGGTSLTNGTDCSGFVQSVYKNFGITIPRDSRSQCAGAGYTVSMDSLKKGDLIFYTNSSGIVNHVALYIGDGKIVHASDPRSGIKISDMYYRTPYRAKRVLN